VRKLPIWLLPVFAGLATAAPARAEEPASTRSAAAGRTERPYTLAQLGVGLLTLPTADVCLTASNCSKGDTSVEADFWQMYRANPLFAIGAGATFALRPTTDTPTTPTMELAGITRSHTRSYFLVEAQVRYYWLRATTIEAWVGATGGGVIVSDRYSVEGGEMPTASLIGPRSSTVRTEGGTVGGLLGAQWSFAPNWAVGFSARYMRWFLPHEAATSVFLDRATLTDQQGVLDFGISCSYRIAL